MVRRGYLFAAGAAGLAVLLATAAALAQTAVGPSFTADGKLNPPTDYRTWIYLSTGFDMSYAEGAPGAAHNFDNVFVDPASYAAFQATGAWPDKTEMVLEVRGAGDHTPVNKNGHYQLPAVAGMEVHVKDTARFAANGGWAFFGFGRAGGPSTMTPASAACYSCHRDHAAVDTTFVQFYPTLMPVAEARKTLSAAYVAEVAAAAAAAAK